MDANELRTLLCPSCGAPIRQGDLECDYCGSAIFAGRATEVAVPALAEAQKVIAEMRARIQVNAYDGDAYYQLGLACFTLKLYDQAENAFQQANRFLPGNALVHYFTGLSTLRNAENEILSLAGLRLDQIQKEFALAAELDPNLHEAKPYFEFVDALIARSREDFAGAMASLNSVVAALPNLWSAWKVLAACSFQVADYRGAIRAGSHALQLNPPDADVAFLIGAAHTRLGEEEEMEAWARRVAALRGNPGAWAHVIREFHGVFD